MLSLGTVFNDNQKDQEGKMNITATDHSSVTVRRVASALLVAASLVLGELSLKAAVLPVQSSPRGKTYAQWSAAWWQWALSHPVTGHPFVDDASFNGASGQSGKVWFLATPFGTVQRSVTIPAGTFLFIGALNAEASDLEGLGATEAEQRDTAAFLADHIVDPAVTVDGVAVGNIDSYRVASAQFGFTAPEPWIFSPAPSGPGTAVVDGYYVMLAPLSVGTHTVRITGGFHFSVAEGDPFDFDAEADVTYTITVR